MQERIMSDQTVERLTEEDVFEVCETLRCQGRDVTRLMSLWEDRQGGPGQAPDVELSAEDSESVQTFARQMLRTLTDLMRRQAAEAAARRTQLAEDERRRVTEVAQAYDDLVSDAERRVAQVQADAARTTEQLRNELDCLTTELRQAHQDLERVKILVVDQEKRLLVERERTEHANVMKDWAFKQRDEEMRVVGEGRAREHLLGIEVSNLKTELNKAKDSLHSLEIHNKVMQKWLDEDKEKLKTLKLELDAAHQEIDKKNEHATVLEIGKAALEANLQAFTDQVDDQREKLAASDSRVAELIATLRSLAPAHGKRTKPTGSRSPVPFAAADQRQPRRPPSPRRSSP
jgi:chromosome segregation ATPase